MSLQDLPVIPADRADDLHNPEIAAEADLVLFMAGNQFMAMAELVSTFNRHIRRLKKSTMKPCPRASS